EALAGGATLRDGAGGRRQEPEVQPVSFGKRLRQLREARGLSREDLALAAGLGRAPVRDYEQGRWGPPRRAPFLLGGAAGVAVAAFKNGAAAAREGPAAEGPARKPSGQKRPARGKGRKRKGE